MTFRFLHLADLHLETRFGGRPAVRDRLRAGTREAFERAVELAVERELHAVLIAGDAFDQEILSRGTELFFVRQVRRLAEAGVHVLWCCGNHDPGGKAHRAAGLGLDGDEGDEPWRARVTLFRTATPRAVRVLDRAGEPVGVVVGAGHPKDREERNLAASFTPLEPGLPRVGLLHTQVDSARGAEHHDRYAPSTRDDLLRVDYDYWALGHVHLRHRPFSDVPAWYAGNLQGRHVNEPGPKGGLVVALEAGEPVEPEFVPLAPVRWERATVDDLAAHASLDALAGALADRLEDLAQDGPGELAARLVLTGPCALARVLRRETDRRELEEDLLDRTGAVEVQLDVRGVHEPRDVDALRRTPCVLAEALDVLEEVAADPRRLLALVPRELAGVEDDADDDARLAYAVELLDGLQEELFERGLREADA